MTTRAIRIHSPSEPPQPDRHEPTLYEPKHINPRSVRKSDEILIDGEYYRIEFAEFGAAPSRVPGTITGRECGGTGQFRLVPIGPVG